MVVVVAVVLVALVVVAVWWLADTVGLQCRLSLLCCYVSLVLVLAGTAVQQLQNMQSSIAQHSEPHW